jgi:hypothetical protein
MDINHIQYFRLAEAQTPTQSTNSDLVEEKINGFKVQLENHVWDTSENKNPNGVVAATISSNTTSYINTSLPTGNFNINRPIILNLQNGGNLQAVDISGENLNMIQNGNIMTKAYQAAEIPNLITRPIGFEDAPTEVMEGDTETSQLRRKMGVFLDEYQTAKDLEERYDSNIRLIQDIGQQKYMMLTPGDVGYDDAISADEALANMKQTIANDDKLTNQMFQDYFNAFNIV